jgi:hypothetical protein
MYSGQNSTLISHSEPDAVMSVFLVTLKGSPTRILDHDRIVPSNLGPCQVFCKEVTLW